MLSGPSPSLSHSSPVPGVVSLATVWLLCPGMREDGQQERAILLVITGKNEIVLQVHFDTKTKQIKPLSATTDSHFIQ